MCSELKFQVALELSRSTLHNSTQRFCCLQLTCLCKREGLLSAERHTSAARDHLCNFMVQNVAHARPCGSRHLLPFATRSRSWNVLDVIDQHTAGVSCLAMPATRLVNRVRNGIFFTEHNVIGSLLRARFGGRSVRWPGILVAEHDAVFSARRHAVTRLWLFLRSSRKNGR